METRGGTYCGFAGREATWAPSVNLYEAQRAYRVCVDLPGVDKATINVSVTPPADVGESPRLVLTGERPVPRSPVTSHQDGGRIKVHRMELDHGPFRREIELPNDVQHAAISASYHGGFLWIELPKA